MYYFGKKPKKSKPSQLLLPAPEVAGTGFGRRSLFGNHMMDKMQPLGQMQPMQFGNYKFGNYKFGKGVGRKKKIAPPPEEVATNTFGKYLRYGNRSFFGRRYFGSKTGTRYPMFGKSRKSRKSVKKGKKPTKALIKMCKKYRIKVTRKVGKKKVYKSVTLLKRLLKRKQRKSKKKVKKSRRSRRRQTRFSLFGLKF